MTFEFRLPDIGEGVIEGEIVRWLVKPGDSVHEDQPMVEVMTDKATVVIPSPKEGVIRETRGREGEMARVHEVLVVIDTGVEPTLAVSAPTPAAMIESVDHAPASAKPNGSVLAAPATRRLARELGVNLADVQATGPAGRVMSADVRAVVDRRAAPTRAEAPAAARPVASKVTAPRPAAPRPVAIADDQIVPVRGMRRAIWESMARSKQMAAHFTFVEECNCQALVEMRKRLNAWIAEGDTPLSYLPFVVKAVISGLRRFPELNAHVDEEAQSFIKRGHFHIGVAVATDRGLMVPVVRNADQQSLTELATEVSRLAEAARSGRITPSELGGSTFTITSLGKDGGLFATPIINHPEVAIMGLHRMISRPVVDEAGQIVVRPMMNLSVSFDHRLIDGHVGAAFAYHVIGLLEQPDRLLLEMR
ncbi:MAG: 2-oxo acid dehydrogenase subunit E2 [Deltaproteobacteria bacterium]|nr:2-oxo acid dehydrogenase subunit E2 [Deltaproteobacteria bacterium]